MATLVAWVRVAGGELVVNIRCGEEAACMRFPLEEAGEVVGVFVDARRTPGSDMTVHDIPDTNGPRMSLSPRECALVGQVAGAVLHKEGVRGCARGAA